MKNDALGMKAAQQKSVTFSQYYKFGSPLVQTTALWVAAMVNVVVIAVRWKPLYGIHTQIFKVMTGNKG